MTSSNQLYKRGLYSLPDKHSSVLSANPRRCSARLAFQRLLVSLPTFFWARVEAGLGLHQGSVGRDTAAMPRHAPLRCFRGVEGRVSAYPDWTAQVEKTPGSSLMGPREVPVHPWWSLRKSEGGAPRPPRYRGQGGHHSLSGLEDGEGGWGWKVWDSKGRDPSKRPTGNIL